MREPELPRPFRVPGGMFGAVAVGIPPMLLLGFSVIRSETEQVLGMSSFAFGMLLIAAGVVAYLLNHALKPEGWTPAQEKPGSGGLRNHATDCADWHRSTNLDNRFNPWPLAFVVN